MTLEVGRVYELDPKTIIVEDRARKDYGDLEGFAANLRDTGGPIQPITITSGLHLLAGGRRLQASILAGLDTVRFLVRNVDGEIDAKEVELFENLYRKDLTWQERAKLELEIYELKRKTEGWSQAKLAETLGQSVGALNRHVQIGKAIREIPQLADAKTEDDAWKAIKTIEEKVLLQELHARAQLKAQEEAPASIKATMNPLERAKALEQHRLRAALKDYRIGNALTEMDKILAIPENERISFDFAEVDPPYGIDLHEAVRSDTGSANLETYHEVGKLDYDLFINAVAQKTYGLLKRDAFAVFWFAPIHHGIVKEAIINAGFSVNDIWGIWYKGPVGQTQQPARNLASSYEPFFIASKGKPAISKQGRSNVFHFAPVASAQKYHQTQKPYELLDEIIKTFCFPMFRVLVPFLGSGVSLRALYKNTCTGFGWDLEVDHKKHFLAMIAEDIDDEEVQRDE